MASTTMDQSDICVLSRGASPVSQENPLSTGLRNEEMELQFQAKPAGISAAGFLSIASLPRKPRMVVATIERRALPAASALQSNSWSQRGRLAA